MIQAGSFGVDAGVTWECPYCGHSRYYTVVIRSDGEGAQAVTCDDCGGEVVLSVTAGIELSSPDFDRLRPPCSFCGERLSWNEDKRKFRCASCSRKIDEMLTRRQPLREG